MRLTPTLTSLAALSLAACGTAEEPADNNMMAENTMQEGAMATDAAAADTPTDAATYVSMAGASDMFEIGSSQLALQKSQNDDVKEFAQMMIDHHRKTTEQVATAAREAGMTPAEPQLNAMQREMMTNLESAYGAEFDRTYIDQQRQAHQKALALHRTYAERGDTPQLQEVARTAVPIIEQHIAEAQELSAT